MGSNCFKSFTCTGVKTVDVTLMAKKNELVMVDLDTLNDIYRQGWYDGMSDTIAEPVFVDIYKMEAEDGHA